MKLRRLSHNKINRYHRGIVAEVDHPYHLDYYYDIFQPIIGGHTYMIFIAAYISVDEEIY